MDRQELMRRRAFELVLALVASYAALPLWAVEHPAIQDLPQHLAAVRVLANYGDPDLAFSQYFTIELARTQYIAYYLAAIVLSWPFGVLVANKILITASIVGTPFALRSLLGALGNDERLALFAIPLTWNAHLILGFLNFTAAIPLALAGLAIAVRLRREWSLRRAILLGLVTVVCFYTHIVPFAFLGLGAALVAIDRDWKRSGYRLLPLVPAGIAAIVWTQVSAAGESTMSAASGGGDRGVAGFMSASQAIAEIPMWLTDVLHGTLDEELLVAFVIVLFLAAATGERNGASAVRARVTILGPIAAALYFVTPASYDWIWPINARFPLLALVFAIPALPRPRGWIGAFVLAAITAISLASSAEVKRAFAGFDHEEFGTLEEATESIPEGARVAGLVFDRGSRHVKFSPFIHAVAWVQAEKGGAVMFTFADFPQSPFAFRGDRRPPRVPPRWEWMPERVDPARDLAWFDYVLVRGGPGRIASQRDAFEMVHRDERWSLWRRVHR